MSAQNWEAVIGLEVHCQLLTRSKIFSGAATAYGAERPSNDRLVVHVGPVQHRAVSEQAQEHE